MATTQKKTTSGARSGGSRSSGGKKGGSRAAPRSRAPAKQPIRREVGGIILLLAGLCVLVSFFTGDGWLINLIPRFLKGLLGVGYFVTVPALAAAAWILINHRGRPVALRTACALLTPYLFGGVWHMLFCKLDLSEAETLFPTLWASGFTLESGGALAGGTAHCFMAVLGKPASLIVFLVLLVVLVMTAAQVTPALLIQLWRDWERPDYCEEDYEDEEDYAPAPPPRRQSRPAPQKKQPAPARKRPSIDIPLDGTPLGGPPPEIAPETVLEQPEERAGFFRPREREQLTPADILAPQPEPPAAPREPEPEPVPFEEDVPDFAAASGEVLAAAPPDPEPAPVEETPPPPPPPQEERRRKKSTAEAVEEATAQVAAEIASGLAAGGDVYDFPPVSLLDMNTSDNYIEAGAELRINAQRLADTLRSFGVDAAAGDVVRGPAITRYEFVLAQGVKLSKVTNLAGDIALALGASGVRIAPILEKISVVGIEVPNKAVSPVLIRDVIESNTFSAHKSTVAFAVGRDIGNKEIVGDIAKLPHVLIAGTTGSGKSVCTNSLIVSLLYKSSPEDVRFIMIDPKMVELAPYNGIPHLLVPVVTDPKKAAGALQWAVFEMMKRYKTFSELGAKKLEEYNAIAARREDVPHMPSVVVVIDELADLMLVAAKEVEESICRVAQMGRAAGMHLVIATQSPRADVITGLMKANIPSRIAFAVASSLESRIILDDMGAEKLVGRGDMLYAPLGSGKPIRVQGCFITPEEIERVVRYVKSTGEVQYDQEVYQKIEESVQEREKKGSAPDAAGAEEDACDELLPAAVEVILETGQASVSMLQRRLKLGYSRAARLVDQMEQKGYVGPFEGSKPRQLLITKAKWQELQMGSAAAPDPAVEDAPWDEE
ncbi:MAG: DNA translocase FtsK [Oscillospiraceae bacterium]|nr:DNA translocase FtsK [Oscillospiraceae bacterium]MCI9318000.1 DNA translocase FtsK [Oscillospiraceae bacterium]